MISNAGEGGECDGFAVHYLLCYRLRVLVWGSKEVYVGDNAVGNCSQAVKEQQL